MPVYEYLCPECQTRFDLRRRISQRDMKAQCPTCEGMQSTRCISLPMVFATAEGGQMKVVSGAGSGCAGCVASSCAGCGF